MRRHLVGFSASSFCLALSFTAAAQQYQTTDPAALRAPSITERMDRGKQEFAKALATEPDRPIAVLISLQTPLDAKVVADEARAFGLRVEGFRHSDAAGSGGYTMQPGESVEEALAQYQYDRQFFSQQAMAQADLLSSETSHQQVREALQRDKDALATRLKAASDSIVVVGVDLFGTPRAISDYSKARSYVRLIELKTGNRIDAAIRPQD